MAIIQLRVDPAQLSNPDADLRYALSQRICDVAGGAISEEGFDYEEGTDAMLIYLRVSDVAAATALIMNLAASERMLDNDLTGAVSVTQTE